MSTLRLAAKPTSKKENSHEPKFQRPVGFRGYLQKDSKRAKTMFRCGGFGAPARGAGVVTYKLV